MCVLLAAECTEMFKYEKNIAEWFVLVCRKEVKGKKV